MGSKGVAIEVKRVYAAAEPGDGLRVLVDRLWPRGLRKAEAHVDLWLKELAPSDDLRRWFGHDPARWEEFRRRYRGELAARPEALAPLVQALGRGRVTLLYAAKDEAHNNAVALREYLETRVTPPPDATRPSTGS